MNNHGSHTTERSARISAQRSCKAMQRAAAPGDGGRGVEEMDGVETAGSAEIGDGDKRSRTRRSGRREVASRVVAMTATLVGGVGGGWWWG